jgi:predicted ester cyclase
LEDAQLAHEFSSPAEVVSSMILGMFDRGVEALEPHPGMDHLRRLFPAIKAAFPDWSGELQQQVVEGNRVASHWLVGGTHTGAIFGVPGSGRQVRFQSISISRVEDGRVVKYNSETGWLDFLMKVGVLPLRG